MGAAALLMLAPWTAAVAEEGLVKVRSANVRETCSLSARVVTGLREGERVEVLGSLGEWHRVRLADGREGCMHDSVLDVGASAPMAAGELQGASSQESWLDELDTTDEETASLMEDRAAVLEEIGRARAEGDEGTAAELERDDLASIDQSLRDRQAELAMERREAQLRADEEAERARREAFEAQERASRRAERRATGGGNLNWFVDLNVGQAWAADDEVEWQTLIDPNAGGGITDDRVTYHNDEDLAFAVGGGALWGNIGGGLRVSRQTHEGQADIDLFRTCAPGAPCPPVDEAHARTAENLEREELALHASFIWAAINGESLVLRLMVGPSYFDVSQETVDDIGVTENPFRIVAFRKGEQDDTAIGWHAAADASWFWGSYGVGLSALYAQGEVDFENRACSRFGPPDPSLCEESVDAGGLQVMGGFRLRF